MCRTIFTAPRQCAAQPDVLLNSVNLSKSQFLMAVCGLAHQGVTKIRIIFNMAMVSLALLLTACSQQVMHSDTIETQLCIIYKGINRSGDLPRAERDANLTTVMQNQMPEFYDEHFVNIMLLDWDDRPAAIRRVFDRFVPEREQALCEPIELYYAAE